VTIDNRRNLKDALSDRTGNGYLSHLVEDLRNSAEIVIPGATQE
jgi:hypothetical protein